MTKMFFRFFLALNLSLIAAAAWSQAKHASVSFRYGCNSIGAVATVHADDKSEVMAIYTSGLNQERKMLTAIYVQHFLIPRAEGMTWYAGAGMHAAVYSDGLKASSRNSEILVTKKKFIGGASAIIGAGYQFRNTPVFLSVDLKPYVDFVNGQAGITDLALGFGIRL